MIQPSILFFLEGRNVPATRFRVEQFEPILTERGIDFRKLYSYPSKYLYYPELIRATPFVYPWAAALLTIVVFVRIYQILRYARNYSVIFLQRDLLYRVRAPLLELFLYWWVRELRAAGKIKIVFDVDDNLLINKAGRFSPSLRSKLGQICSKADQVICGNDYLAALFSQYSPKVTVVPTVIDTSRYVRVRLPDHSRLVIGWTGISSNLNYLSDLEEALNEVALSSAFVMRVICQAGSPAPFKNPKFLVELVPWQRASEIDDLADFDIGIMPLPDTEFTKGKCGFKLLQYMALGIPAVASPVGVNSSIIIDGRNGFLARSPKDWSRIIKSLLEDAELRARVGAEGQKTVDEHYSLRSWASRWIEAVV